MTTYFEEDFESFDDEAPLRWGALMNWAGAIVSLALMAGLGVWGYQLLIRDVSGVPVVRALEGPMRVAPEDPGGTQAEYQDLTVTRVASAGAEEEPVDQVVLAPRPVELADEDKPMAAMTPETKTLPLARPEPPAEATAQELAAGEADLAPLVETAPSPAAAPVEEDTPLSAIELAIAEALEGTAAPGTSEARVTPAMSGGVVRSIRPQPRPSRTAAAVVTEPVGNEVPVETIPPGTRLVQLGAFPSADRAREVWDELEGTFGAYFNGKRRVVQEASAGGSTFYRLRAMGFDDLSDARRFCAVLVAENANCIPVIRR